MTENPGLGARKLSKQLYDDKKLLGGMTQQQCEHRIKTIREAEARKAAREQEEREAAAAAASGAADAPRSRRAGKPTVKAAALLGKRK